jgi:acetoin utilization deacetylase AcuC-like enzyme
VTLDVFWHEDVLAHDTGQGVFEAAASPLMAVDEPHPEGPERVRNMLAILQRGPLAGHVRWRDGRHATRAELELVHEPAYVDEVERLVAAGGGRVTPTTVAGPATFAAAAAAAGTAVAAACAVLDGETHISYALVRPPGHHAQPAQADGYCFFNSAAIAAEAARRRGVERVAIVDWDVHHGNGTQECFYARDDVLTVSLHMAHGSWGPSHPQTGAPDEVGAAAGAGYNVNVAMPLGTGDAGYLAATERIVAPILERFAPGLVIIAAGQDAGQFDPNGRQSVTMAGFRALGRAARGWADRHCEGRLVLVQEGGYAPSYAAWCLHATLEGVLALDATLPDPLAYLPDAPGHAGAAIDAARAALAPYWDL